MGWRVRLAIKHQGNNPTGSFKDLGMTACITASRDSWQPRHRVRFDGQHIRFDERLRGAGRDEGRRYRARRKISAAKLAQALEFGAVVIEIGETFDDSFRLLRALTAELNLYLVNSLNPFRLEGQKTIVCEILEQRDWRVPEYIVVPGGNLGNVSAIGKGLRELKELGLIEKLPRLVVTQAEGANPFYRMVANNSAELIPVAEPRTEASAIRIGNPVNWKKAIRAIRATEGMVESVSDDEIFAAKAALAHDGVGCEPASATTIAGIRKLVASGKNLHRGADIVAVLTGHQLKDPEIKFAPARRRRFGRGSACASSRTSRHCAPLSNASSHQPEIFQNQIIEKIRATTSALNEKLFRTLGGLHDSFDQRDAQLAVFEFENAVNRAACGRRDGLLEKRGMIAGFEHHARRSKNSLRREQCRHIARQSDFHPGFRQRFKNDVDVRRSARRKAGDRIHVLAVHDHGAADDFEKFSRGLEVIRVRVQAA